MKFTVVANVTVSAHTVVEADTEDEAIEIAMEREVAGLCFRPFDAEPEEAWHIDTDGSPENVRVDGVEEGE